MSIRSITSVHANRIRSAIARLVKDDTGFVISMELVIISTIAVLGLIVALAAVRDSVASEISDVAGAIQDLNMSFSMLSISSPFGSTAGSSFEDSVDFCDSPEDAVGEMDNCIEMSDPIQAGDPVAEPTGGGPVKRFVISDPGAFDFDGTVNGVGGSATGTIGSGGITTDFDITTDTGNIGGSSGVDLAFSEDPDDAGRFTIEFDEPVVDFEFFIRNYTNIAGQPENLLGNFTLELSDGTIINNAAFTILPDAIAPFSTYGEFQTGNVSVERVVTVTRGGNQYITDPTYNNSSNQAAGRLVFPGVPAYSGPPGAGTVGVKSLSFDKSGGPNNYRAFFSASGRVIDCVIDP